MLPNKWFKLVVYIMIAAMLLSTILFTLGYLLA